MNRLILVAALTVLFGAPALSQEMQSADPSTSQAESRSTDGTAMVPVLVTDTRGQNDADARECLQFSGNDEISRCAEKYRPRVSRAAIPGASKTERAPDARKSRDGEKAAEATASAAPTAGTPTLKSADALGTAIVAKSGAAKP